MERKRRLDGSQVEFRCERLGVEPGRHALLRFVTTAERRIEGTDLTLARGTVTLGHFWSDRPYTLYAFSKDGAVLAHYFSIVEDVRIAQDSVEYLDLVVDVLVDPRGTATVLDEDELPEQLAPRHRRTINTALEEIGGNTRRIIAEAEHEGRAYR